jgi:hypothetical protein
MKTLTTLASAAAVAVTLAIAAAPAHAAVIAQFDPDSNASDFKWINNAASNLGTGGHIFTISNNAQTSAHGTAVHFSFLDGTLGNAAFIPATFVLDATASSGNPATLSSGSWFQKGINGVFSFIYTGADILNFNGTGITLAHNTNLLSGVFNNAIIHGASGSGGINLSTGSGTLTFTSDYDHKPELAGTQEFAINLLAASPTFFASATHALRGFRANGGGNFSADTAAIPEPATWGLMIVGFGGLGAMVRSSRRRAAAAAA